MIKVIITACLVILYILTSVYLYKTYPKKIREIAVIQTIGYVILGKSILNNYNSYNLYKVTDTLSNITFFCMVFFLLYFDYGDVEDGTPDMKEIRKRDFLMGLIKKSEDSKIILTKNKRFIFFLFLTVLLEATKAIMNRI